MNRLAILTLAFAATMAAQKADHPQSVGGTVTAFKSDPLRIGVKPDDGKEVFPRFGPDTEVVRVAPGQRDLAHAQAGRMTDIFVGDRVLVSFAGGEDEARRIVLISAQDIARRNEAERSDWQQRGISGAVVSRNGEEIGLEIRSFQGTKHVTIQVSDRTKVRRYAPGSVKFADAQLSGVQEITVRDQIYARGDKSEDGARLNAEDVVFGTFQTRIGRIVAVDRDAGEIQMEDLGNKEKLTVRLTADTKLKSAGFTGPGPGAGQGPPAAQHGQPSAPASLAQMLQQLPAVQLGDLKPGGAAVVTSTRGSSNGTVMAIMVIANVDGLLKAAMQNGPAGESPLDAMNRMHGGMLGGPGGVNLPAMLP